MEDLHWFATVLLGALTVLLIYQARWVTSRRRAGEHMAAVCAFIYQGQRLRREVSGLRERIEDWEARGEEWEQRVLRWLRQYQPSFGVQFLLEMPPTQQLGSPFAANIQVADWMNRLDRRLMALSKLVDYLRDVSRA